MKKSLVLIFILIGIFFLAEPANAMSKLHVEGRHIKDEQGDIIFLRGVNKNTFLDFTDGLWDSINSNVYSGAGKWNETAVRENLKAMRDQGFNVLRIQISVDWWLRNYTGSTWQHGTSNKAYITSLRDTVRLAGEYGIYVLIAPYCTDCTVSDPQDHVPWPPYSQTTSIIKNLNGFVDFWGNVSNLLKSYPNVMYDLWNEPNSETGATVETWLDGASMVVNRIRSIGDNNLIFIHWGYSSDFGWVDNTHTPKGSNIVYSSHIYDNTFTWDRAGYTPISSCWWQYDCIKTRLTEYKYSHVINDLNLPTLVGEIGADLFDNNGEPIGLNQSRENEWYNNTLKILNEWKIGYAAWVWRPQVPYTLLKWINTWDPYSPNPPGNILINAIAAGKTINVLVSGQLKDKNNYPIQATISIDSIITSTDSKGTYILRVPQGIYDVNYSLQNFWIKLLSYNINEDKIDLINYITWYTNKNVSFTLDVPKELSVQVYSDEKPKRVSAAGTVLTEVFGLSGLTSNTWFYDSTEQKLHMIVSPITTTTTTILTSSTTSTTSTTTTTTTTIPPSNLIGYWKFDEGSGSTASDSSDYSNDGIIYGATWATGRVGNALSFDGNDYVDCSNDSSLNPTKAITIGAWIKFSSLDYSYSYPYIIAKYVAAGDRQYYILFRNSTKKIEAGFVNNGNYKMLTSLKSDWVVNQWYNIVWTYDANGGSNNMKLYVDGVLDAQNTYTGDMATYTASLIIGSTTKWAGYFKGTIDEVRIWNRALTEEEVRNEY